MKLPLRFILLTVVMMLLGFSARAGSITEEQAMAKAQSFLQTRNVKSSSKRYAPARTQKKLYSTPTGEKAFYVFNVGENEGFVIVASDDRARSILGYADSGYFDVEQIPTALHEMLAIYARQINMIGQVDDKSDSEARVRKAPLRISGTLEDVDPMLTTTWNQGDPYNAYCPTLNDQTALTGCVATAMAQIAYYHKYPTTQVPSLTAYTSETNKINVSAWGATTFDWDNMLDSYDGSETNAQKAAVATLMRYCGQAAQMDYGFTSGAYNGDALYAFTKKLGYNANAEFRSASAYSADGWENLIYKEISEGRPVYYSALNGDVGCDVSGHAFVIDGYRADGNYFHVNWGWGGTCDGYFNLFALDPNAPESPVSSTGWHYQMLAIVGLSPEAEGPHQWIPTACEFKEGKPLYLRHAATGQYLTGANNYSTTTSLTSNGLDDTMHEPIIFSIREETAAVSGVDVTGYVLRMDGTFTFGERTFTDDEVMRENETNCYVDRNGRDNSYLWKIVKVGNYYRIYTADGDPNFGDDGYMLGHIDDEGTILRMISPEEADNASVDWEFVPVAYVETTGITLDESHIELQLNDELQLTATVLPYDARNKKVYWETEDESIATVNSEGLVHAVGVGSTVVRAITDDGGYEAECEVVVTEPVKVASITFREPTLTIEGGERVTLQVTVEPDDAQNKNIKWGVADATIASVNAWGEIRGLRQGTTTVTATADDGSGVQATCTINVSSDDTTLETGWIIPKAIDEPWMMSGIVSDNEPDNDAADEPWTSPDYDDSSWQTITGPLSSDGAFFEGNTNLDQEWIHYYLRGTFYLPEMFGGIYTIHALHDDGMTMWVNGHEVLDEGCNGDYGTYELSPEVLVSGINTIAIHYWADGNPNGFDYGIYYETIPDTYTDEQGLTYALDAKTMTATVTGCDATATEVSIPETIYHCTVTGIADRAFEQAEALESITLRKTQPWVIPETTFSEDIYSGATLKVPYGALEAYHEAEGWSRFQTITFFLPETYTDQQGIVYTLCDDSYYEVTGHTDDISGDITIANEILDMPVTVIGYNAFRDCGGITSVEIPNSITDIRDNAFAYCSNLTSVTGMEGISDDDAYEVWDVFYGTAISDPVYAGSVFYYMPPFMTGEYEMPAGIMMTAAGSMRESQLSAITLPASLTILGDDTFQDCPNLADIYCYAATPPECISGVWENGFDRDACIVHVPISVVEDYQNAEEWRDMGSIVGIYTGDLIDMTLNVTTAGTLNDELFDAAVAEAQISDKTLIRNLTITGSINADDIAYLNTLPGTLYNMMMLDLSAATLEDNAITERMFYQARYKAIKLPETVISIAYEAFLESRRLREITLPESLEHIDSHAFDGSGLTSITIPDGVTEMGDRILQNCRSLVSATVGNGVSNIPDCWAEFCDNLKEVTIGKRVTSIYWRAFRGFNLTDVYCYAKNPPSWDEAFYDGINENAVLHVYSNCVTRYQNASGWQDFPTILGDLGNYPAFELSVNVTEMGTFSEALQTAMTAAGCEDMTDITKLTVTGNINQSDLDYLRDNVGATLDMLDLSTVTVEGNAFGDDALANCGFEEVVLPISIERIEGWSVLENCINIKTIDIPKNVKYVSPNILYNATSLETITGGNGVIDMDGGNGMYFDNCPNLKSPVILNKFFFRLPLSTEGAYMVPEHVTTIARDAMWHVTGLTALTLPEGISTIYGNAFAGDENLKNIYFYAVELPYIDGEAFNDFDRSNCTLHVYEEMMELFQADEIWSEFNIVGDLGTMPNLIPMNETDYVDLCAIYNMLEGDSWANKWIINKNVQTASRWRGVAFDKDGFVTSIDLNNNGLSGDISSLTFSGLTKLTNLNLSSNAITGDIQPLVASLPKGCTLNVEQQNLGYQGEHTLYELCNYDGLPSIAYYQSQTGTLASTLIGVNGYCQFYHEGTNGGQYWDSYIYADGGTVNNFKFYWPSPTTVECFYPHHFTFTYKYDMGDANMDDILNVLDLQTILNYSNGQQWGLFNFYAADTYGQDNDINVQDIVSTVNILLTQENIAHAAARVLGIVGPSDSESCVSVENGQIVLYTTKPVAALDLRLADIKPESLSWKTQEMGFATSTSEQTDGTHAIIYSMQPREIKEGRTVLATFDASLNPDITSAVLSDSKACLISVSHIVPTGICKQNGDIIDNWSLTDLSGLCLISGTHATESDIFRLVKSQQLQGVFILNTDDTKRKIVIK